MTAPSHLAIFDCDSTLASIEGVDELARLRGPDCFTAVEAMTRDAMDGRIAVELVFGQRLEIIRPSAADMETVGRRYIETVEPFARETLGCLRAAGWTPIILSGGFRPAIRLLADYLQIARVEAVDLMFDSEGSYAGFAADCPTTRSGGKLEVVRALREELQPERVVMIGDGVSDLETRPAVDSFIGFGRYVVRERVQAKATHFIRSLAELPTILV